MKPCHLMKTMVLQFMLEGRRPRTILCLNGHATAEYLERNVSIGQLLQHILKSIVVCVRSRPKMLTKHITEKFVKLHNHFLLLTFEVFYQSAGHSAKTHNTIDLVVGKALDLG